MIPVYHRPHLRVSALLIAAVRHRESVPGIPGFKVLTGVSKGVRGLQTSSAPGDVSRRGAWYFADALRLTRAGSVWDE
jgi:hypothetical protein